MAKLIELKGISKSYDGEKVIDSMNLYIRDGEFITLLGPSGCGKTTLGRAILKLHEPTGGNIIFEGKDITDIAKFVSEKLSVIDGIISVQTHFILKRYK